MKKHKIIITMILMCVLMFGSVITTHASFTGARATRFGLTTNEGNYIAYNDMTCEQGYDNILSNYQSDTYSTYTNYSIMYFANDNEEYYWVTFCKEGKNITYKPLISGGKYLPRLSCTSTECIIFECKHNIVDDIWEVKPTSSAPIVNDASFYSGYDSTDENAMKEWTKQHIAYTNVDILEHNTSKVFFQAPKVVLAPVVGKIPLKGATAQILMMMPICLALLVGYLGLRKALSVLQTILHRA